MDSQRSKTHRIAETVIAMAVLLLAFFFQGAAVVVGGIEGIKSVVIRGLIIWALVLLTVAFFYVKYRRLDLLGLRKPDVGSYKDLCYFIPLILIALIYFSSGLDVDSGLKMIPANLFLALGIGFCEEIFFRGIILNLWLEKGEKVAIAVSSVLFAVCHLMNIAGGAGVVETILQVCFALVYGVVCALIFLACRSVWPCIMLHAFHDFCSFTSAERSTFAGVICGAVQFIILFLYAFLIVKRRVTSTEPT